MSKAVVGAGNVAIKLMGQDYTLVPSLSAMQGVSRLNNGIRGAIDEVIRLNFDTIVRVISLGLGGKVANQIKDLPSVCYNSGLVDGTEGELAAKCVEFLTILSNGGRPVNKDDADETSDDPQ